MKNFLNNIKNVILTITLFALFGMWAQAQQVVKITNRWTNENLGLQSGNPICSTSAPDTWIVEKVGEGDYVRLKNAATGTYLHNETGQLGAGAIQPGWWSAQWTLAANDGHTNIINRWTGGYIHNERGKLEIGPIDAPGWWSAQWAMKPASGSGNQANNILADPEPDDPRKRLRLTPLSKDRAVGIQGTSQSMEFNMRVNGFIYAYTLSPQQKIVHLTTQGSIAKPGVQADNTTDKRGFFLEKLEITIEPTTGAEHVYRDMDSPATDTNTGSRTVTSSVDVGAGLSADGGSLTAGAGGSDSFTQNIDGFKYLNNSNGKKLHHVIQLASSSVGPYESYKDLLDMGFVGSFSGTPLGELPHQAINNMPIIAQGLWQTYDGNFSGKVTFKITYKMDLRWVEKTNYFFTVDTKSTTTNDSMTEYITVDFGSIK
ncbi:MAG: RICIN domain-containing protein [Sphingobacteriales bacterium]|nr:MAG: RICIN domain-containing protein [Sphingobacteriales bacterium]